MLTFMALEVIGKDNFCSASYRPDVAKLKYLVSCLALSIACSIIKLN